MSDDRLIVALDVPNALDGLHLAEKLGDAVSFYKRMGYKKSTGARSGPCFDGEWFPYQPMKKVLVDAKRSGQG